MKKTKEGVNLKKKKFLRLKNTGSILVFMGLLIIFVIALYTFILQSSYTKTALETEIARDTASADAVHKLVNGRIGKEDFDQIKDQSDEKKQIYKDISSYFNEIRTLNSTRYIYTATKNEEGKFVYVVDGLDSDADDVRHPGDYIEEEMVPYIDRAISGENVYSQDIIDTTWGPIFTACYPVSANHDGTGEIIGAFCIEMDMQSAYGMVEETNHISIICGLVAGAVLLLICLYSYYVYQKSKAEEQKQKQLLMNAAEEADAANKAKSAFLLSISHDIRTPMNAIIGFTNIALHQNTVSDIHDSLEKVQKSSNHLLSLLNDVLDFSRIESGKVIVSPEPVDITQLTDNVQAIMNGLLYNRDLKFEVHRERPKNPYVLADVTRIREVLVNLLGNAVKFTKDGGKITLDISSYPGTDEKHIIIRYVVQDNGIGMSEEFQKELFKPFSQEDNANARTKYKGTGLGMAITKKYIDMMGGSIAVESKKGVGTTFTVEIPLELTEQVIQSKQPLHRDLTGVHVLMAEDNDLNAELATIMLEDAGMTVTRASDGKEVVNLFKNHPRDTYDLILMDIMMPNMDGHQATKAIRAMGIERLDAVRIPIIALSANAFIDDIQESLDSGMNDHISKPINMEEVTDTIAKYIKDDTCLETELKQKQNDR
ncbi:response regulator [Anaerobutyricum hallii]|uniref:ATP-binding protein n=1 Tax=Anaerobutyricum hallii TaxID=39488 RepID=UPI001ADDA2DB|nr:ATP-binding protein [Anaerobutyricum hallii]MBP0063594.1 response regulator [Anaerobutyricum hallii]MBP0068078.1 response regulator [Anaerobutyricum hallii]